MPETVTIYRCDAKGRVESAPGCVPDGSGEYWTIERPSLGAARFYASDGWTESQRDALDAAVEHHSRNARSKTTSHGFARTGLARAVRAYSRFLRQEADNA